MKGNKGHTDPDTSLTVASNTGLSQIQVAVQGFLKNHSQIHQLRNDSPVASELSKGPRDLTKRC